MDDLALRPGSSADLPAVADLFLAVRAASVPAIPPVADPADARSWVLGWDLGRDLGAPRELWLAVDDDGPVGFALVEDDWLHSLYVAVEAQGSGVGAALLDVVKARRPVGFGLWVFESNAGARRFYARHGLVEVERTDGRDNQERQPDVRMVWPAPPGPV